MCKKGGLKYRLAITFFITIFQVGFTNFISAQNASIKISDTTKYYLHLNIPPDWEISRQVEGKDYTLFAESPDQKLYVYYCQFMDDNEVRPKKYLKTYTSQFGLENAKKSAVTKNIGGENVKLYYAKGKGTFLDQKFTMLIMATAVKGRNVIAYLMYPWKADEGIEKQVERVLLKE